MGYAIEQSVGEVNHSHRKTVNWFKSWKFITTSILIIITITFTAIIYYQLNHFNTNIMINGVNVGGLTAEQTLEKLQASVLTNEVLIGEQQILDGKDTRMSFTESDLPGLTKLLESQWTIFPSVKENNFPIVPVNGDKNRILLKHQVREKLISMNQQLQAPYDSHAILEQGSITITKSIAGTKYDVNSLLKEFETKEYTSDIRLNPVYIQPHSEDSPIVKNKVQKLHALLQLTVDYKVQDQVYSLKASELIKNASISDDMEITIDPTLIKNRITEINNSQSTLGKDFTFTTQSGSVIQVKGEGYGWALDVEKETKLLQEVFEKGETSISASNIYGNGWQNEGYGFETVTNDGIGNTYAEVSIKEQRLWLYKDGKQIFTTPVVTGKSSNGQDTLPGVWYILYKRTPYTLTGSSEGSDYSIKVNYWAPFTNSGQGFHDASWRSNWSNNAYLDSGSNGCVNVPPNVMKIVYENLSTYQPVVIY